MDQQTMEVQDSSIQTQPLVTVYCTKNEIVAKIPYNLSQSFKDHVVAKRFNRSHKTWHFPLSCFAAYYLHRIYGDAIQDKSENPTFLKLANAYQQSLLAKQGQYSEIPNLQTTPWDHQNRAYSFAKYLTGAALICGMGTGKTLMALGIIQSRAHKCNMVVCPKNVLSVWPDQIIEHATDSFVIANTDSKKTIAKRVEDVKRLYNFAWAKNRPFIMLTNYEAFWREKMAEFIKSVWWDNIIYDEIQHLKDPKGKAAKFSHELLDYSTYRLGLTGTFIPNNPTDVFSQCKALDSSVLGNSFFRFKNQYCEMGGFAGKEIVNYKNQEELHDKIESLGIQISSDVLDLPEEVHSYRNCELNKDTKRTYDELSNEFYSEIDQGEITVANAMVKLLKLQQLTSGHLKTDNDDVIDYGYEKYNLLVEMFQEIPKDEPVVVFARFIRDLKNIRQAAEKTGRSSCEMSGRSNDLQDFKNGDYNVMATQIQSGGEGIDLSRACYCIYYSIGHSLGQYQQSLRRINRPGQTRPVFYYYLIAKDTVDERVYSALRNKQDVVEYIMNMQKE